MIYMKAKNKYPLQLVDTELQQVFWNIYLNIIYKSYFGLWFLIK